MTRPGERGRLRRFSASSSSSSSATKRRTNLAWPYCAASLPKAAASRPSQTQRRTGAAESPDTPAGGAGHDLGKTNCGFRLVFLVFHSFAHVASAFARFFWDSVPLEKQQKIMKKTPTHLTSCLNTTVRLGACGGAVTEPFLPSSSPASFVCCCGSKW